MYEQISVFLMSCVIGGVLGLIYDIFRITRIAVKTHKIIVFIEDVIFFIISAFISFVFVMIENNGEIRGLLIIGEVLGAVIYFFSISVVIIKSAELIIKFVKAVSMFIYKILIKPFVKVFFYIKNKITIIIMQKKLQLALDELNLND